MQLDFFFSHGSTYTYLAAMRIEKLAAAAGVALRWRPFHLRTILKEMNNQPFVGKPARMKYMWRDLERRAMQHGIAFNGIPPYPIDMDTLAQRVGVLAASEGWGPEYTKAHYRTWFMGMKDPGTPENLRATLEGIGRDADALMRRADSDEALGRLTVETDVARALGIFGSPTFVVGDELFWGDDRLETALDWCRTAQR